MTNKTNNLDPKAKIAVLYGGLSSERRISLISGKNCYEALLRLGYENTVLIDVGHDIAERLREEKPDYVYNILHGKYGEDGCIQGVLEMMGIPYTGCDVRASALTMDKALTKAVLEKESLPVLPDVTVDLNEKHGDLCQVIALNYPVIVKPLNEGSSVGMSKVNDKSELKKALDFAGQYCNQVMVEEFRAGKSITVGVVEIDGEPVVTPILEMKPKNSDWYDIEAKYTEGATEFILPATLSDDVTKKIQDVTLKAFKVCGCSGVSRIDYIVDATDENRFYILEVNTLPGMTNISDLPQQANHMGISFDLLVEYILVTAEKRRQLWIENEQQSEAKSVV